MDVFAISVHQGTSPTQSKDRCCRCAFAARTRASFRASCLSKRPLLRARTSLSLHLLICALFAFLSRCAQLACGFADRACVCDCACVTVLYACYARFCVPRVRVCMFACIFTGTCVTVAHTRRSKSPRSASTPSVRRSRTDSRSFGTRRRLRRTAGVNSQRACNAPAGVVRPHTVSHTAGRRSYVFHELRSPLNLLMIGGANIKAELEDAVAPAEPSPLTVRCRRCVFLCCCT